MVIIKKYVIYNNGVVFSKLEFSGKTKKKKKTISRILLNRNNIYKLIYKIIIIKLLRVLLLSVFLLRFSNENTTHNIACLYIYLF
jgi:hypothetical protein